MHDVIRELVRRIEELERRHRNVMREAKVVDTDYEKGLIKVQDGDLRSTWVPWVERAGDIRTWTPPAKDEQVILFSPSGEPGQGWVLPGQFSDKFKQNHDKGAEHKMTIGDTFIFAKDGEVRIKADKIVLEGNCYIGGEDGAKPASREGTIDTDGDAEVANFATKVWLK